MGVCDFRTSFSVYSIEVAEQRMWISIKIAPSAELMRSILKHQALHPAYP